MGDGSAGWVPGPCASKTRPEPRRWGADDVCGCGGGRYPPQAISAEIKYLPPLDSEML
jgi:hypothetical protein